MSVFDNGNTGMYMPVAPAYAGGNGGFGGWGDDAWLILIILLACGGWGGFGGFGMGGFGGGLGYDFPWLLNGQNGINANTNAGFNQAATAGAISGLQSSVTSGFGDVQTALCGGFAGVNATVNNAQNALAQQLYTNQIADLERSFNAQTASTQGMTALQSQLAQCCCDNRLATNDLKYTIATENCADRYEAANNTRDIIDTINTKVQGINDKLCALELDGYKRENDNLRQQLNMASLASSQNAQTARIEAGQRALANEVEQYVNPTPIPAYVVQNPNCCTPYTVTPNCGCNNGIF